MSQHQTPVIAKFEDLLANVELRDVVYWEVSGKRVDESSEETPLRIEAMWRQSENQLGTRFHATVVGEGGEFVADAEAIFDIREPQAIDPSVVQAFVERIGIMVVFPFLRSAIAETATKLALPRPVLRLLRAGEAQFANTNTE